MFKIGTEKARDLFSQLSRSYKIIAPVIEKGMGRFSHSDLCIYRQVRSFEEIEFFGKTYYSPKEIFFPVRKALFDFQSDGVKQAEISAVPMIIFLRACDINAVSVLDYHFLEKDGYEDIYYKVMRQRFKFVLLECKQPFDNCFCVSLGTNKTENYSVFMRKVDDGYEVQVQDRDLENYFSSGESRDVEPEFVQENFCSISLPEEIDTSIFKSKIWKEYSLRCTACGRCNLCCPTCTCFTVQDIASEDDLQEEINDFGQRQRIWSSCQVKNFSLLAGGHDFRTLKGDRMRYKVLHKIRDFKKKAGFSMCVGCGRCEDVCPEYISMFKCIEKINNAVYQGAK
ncbi:MAG: anaerobic sulfite reductase subunit AsrA [Nitrospirota bacterium]